MSFLYSDFNLLRRAPSLFQFTASEQEVPSSTQGKIYVDFCTAVTNQTDIFPTHLRVTGRYCCVIRWDSLQVKIRIICGVIQK